MNTVKKSNAQPLLRESVPSITAIGSQPATKRPGKNGISATIDLFEPHPLATCRWSNNFFNAVKQLEIFAVGGKQVGIALAARSSKMILPKRPTRLVPSTRSHWSGEMKRTSSFVCPISKKRLKPCSVSLISLHQRVDAKRFKIL